MYPFHPSRPSLTLAILLLFGSWGSSKNMWESNICEAMSGGRCCMLSAPKPPKNWGGGWFIGGGGGPVPGIRKLKWSMMGGQVIERSVDGSGGNQSRVAERGRGVTTPPGFLDGEYEATKPNADRSSGM